MLGGLFSGIGSLAGAAYSTEANKKQAREQMNLQKDFAQNSIQWRVNDAKKAGLHPLFALGANTPTYTPTSYDNSMGQGISDAVAGIGRSASSFMDKKYNDKLKQLNLELLQGQVEAQRLQNSNLAGQNSNQQNSINEGISQRVAQDIFDSRNSNRIRESYNPTRSGRYSGGDYGQAYDEYATEHALKNKLSEYLNMPPHEQKRVKVDLLRSVGQPGLRVVPKDDLTTFDYYFYNTREKLFRGFDRVKNFFRR